MDGSPRPPRVAAPGPATPSFLPSGYLVAALALLVLAPVGLAAWAVGVAALRSGARRRALLLPALLPAVAGVLFLRSSIGAHATLAASGVLNAAGSGAMPSWALLGPVAGWFGRWALLTAPIGFPAGLAAAALPSMTGGELRPEWTEQERRRRAREEARTRKRTERQVKREEADPRSEALGVSLGGNLDTWRIGHLVVPPPKQLGLTTLLVGAPGTGKTTASERLAYLAAQQRRHLTVIDGKGTDGLDEAIAAAVLAAWPDARIRVFPAEAIDLWRGTEAMLVNKLISAWTFTDEAEFYEQAAMLGLRLALTAAGPPCHASGDLVERLDPAWLTRAWQGNTAVLSLIRKTEKRLADVALRMANLAAALGPAFDGAWSFEDCDVALLTVPTLVKPKDADAAMRILLSDYGQYITTRRERRPSTLLFDEFGALQGGRPLAINLVERSRSAGAGIILSAQSAAGLGPPTDRERLMASANAVILFRSPMPAELAALAGTERTAEGAWSLSDPGQTFDRVTVTERSRARVDQDRIRQARTGEAEVISGGRVERVRVVRTPIPDAARAQARGLTELCAPAPARPVGSREIPGPDPSPQEPSAPTGRPAGVLDPPAPGRVRRYPSPGAGEADPPTDRNNREADDG
jgi:hypothetical protein